MKYYLQYFNCEKMGRFPNGADGLLTTEMGVFTKLASVKGAEGATVFVIAGLGKPKQCFLWEAFTIRDIEVADRQYTISGPGWILRPPQALSGAEFDGFKKACANFVSFRGIDELPYHKTLIKLADKYHTDEVNADCEKFCDELVRLLPKNGDTWYYRGMVRQRLNNPDGARADFTEALQKGTNFPEEARAALQPTPKPAGKQKSSKIAEQIVARGRHAQKDENKPKAVPEVTWQDVLQRRGDEDLRQKLLEAYGGRCAITNYDVPDALEVAMLVGDGLTGEQAVTNAILLRSDVRVLFDLHLIRVHPVTKKIILAEEVQKTRYAKYWSRQLRLPPNLEDRPSHEALRERWAAGGGDKR